MGSKSENTVKASDILVSDQERVIDFKGLLQKYRDRTEFSIPYTIMQVEDVMFINEKTIVALEYIFYNQKGKYSKIKSDKDNACTQEHNLGLENYKHGE